MQMKLTMQNTCVDANIWIAEVFTAISVKYACSLCSVLPCMLQALCTHL